MTNDNACTSLALYDWQGEIDTVQFHEFAREFFEANGVLPNVCAITRPDGSSRNSSYTIMAGRLRSEPLSEFIGLRVYHAPPPYAQLVFAWNVTAGLSNVAGKMIVFCCDQTMRGLEISYFEPLLERIGQIVTLQYGIGYSRSFEFGPSLYAYGMSAGLDYSDEEMAEGDRIAAWFHESAGRKRHLAGYLRDVYPLNVLSEKHLSQRVEGMPMADWIGRSPVRGTLRGLPRGAWLWRIDEANIESVRAVLADAGLLIAYLPR